MESTSTESTDANDGRQRPELRPENQMVSTYFEDHSEIYRDLVKVQDDVSDFKFPEDWYSFPKFSSRCGEIRKLPSTSKSDVAKQRIQFGRTSRHSLVVCARLEMRYMPRAEVH